MLDLGLDINPPSCRALLELQDAPFFEIHVAYSEPKLIMILLVNSFKYIYVP